MRVPTKFPTKRVESGSGKEPRSPSVLKHRRRAESHGVNEKPGGFHGRRFPGGWHLYLGFADYPVDHVAMPLSVGFGFPVEGYDAFATLKNGDSFGNWVYLHPGAAPVEILLAMVNATPVSSRLPVVDGRGERLIQALVRGLDEAKFRAVRGGRPRQSARLRSCIEAPNGMHRPNAQAEGRQ